MSTLLALAGSSRTATHTVSNFFLLVLARLPFKLTGGILISSLFLLISNPSLQREALIQARELSSHAFPITESVTSKTYEISFSKKEFPDKALAVGETKLVQVGKNGLVQEKTRSLLFQGKEFAQDVTNSTLALVQDQVISFGTKKVYQNLNTPDGQIAYWNKLRMFSTSYDSHCQGCNETTAIGLKAGYGVVAIDPKVIPLKTKLYIPGYGFAVAGDTGSSIKGDKIDLGFDNVKNGWWSARFTDVYLLSE